MPRFRNTTVMDALPYSENGSAMRRSGVSGDTCMSPAFPPIGFPTPPSSPVSVSPSSCLPPSLSSYTPSPSRSTSSPSSPPLTPVSPPSVPKQKRLPSSTSTPSQHHIPRPRNAFILFRSHASSSGLVTGLTQQNLISREAGRLWRAVDKKTREEFQAMAREEQRVHKAKWPEYRYAPGPRKGEGMDVGNIKIESGVVKKETKMKVKVNTSTQRRPVLAQRTSMKKTKMTNPKRTLPTPDVTPERSAPAPPLVLVLQDTEAQANFEPEPETFQMDEDTERDDYYFPPFNVFADAPETPFEDINNREAKQPEFTFPPSEDDSPINSSSIPCLASSTYSTPTFIHADRRLLSSPTSSPSPSPTARPTPSSCLSFLQDHSDSHGLVKRALRPSAPLWHLDFEDVSKQRSRDELGFLHTFHFPSSPSLAASSNIDSETMPNDTLF